MVFSFYPTKPVGSCDGGMIVSNDLEKITRLKEMALNGMSYAHNNWERKIKFAGYKMYMNSIQCDIALKNFNLYEDKLARLSEIRNIYNEAFGLNNTSNHLYRISVDSREKFIIKLKEHGVSTGIHYDAAHLNPVYKLDNTIYPLSEIAAKDTVSIPFHENLTFHEINLILRLILDKYDN